MCDAQSRGGCSSCLSIYARGLAGAMIDPPRSRRCLWWQALVFARCECLIKLVDGSKLGAIDLMYSAVTRPELGHDGCPSAPGGQMLGQADAASLVFE